MSLLRNVDAPCYLAHCAGDFAGAQVSGSVALAAGEHRFESALGTLTLDTGPGTTLSACSRPGAGIVLGATRPIAAGLTNIPAEPSQGYVGWAKRCALSTVAKSGTLQVSALQLGGGEAGELVTARGRAATRGVPFTPQLSAPILATDARVQAKWDALRESFMQALSTGLRAILRHDMVATAGLIDLPQSDLKLTWKGGEAVRYERTTVQPGDISLRVGSKRRDGAHLGDGEHEVGARLAHDLALVDARGQRTPLQLKAKCVLSAQGPALVGNTGYPAAPEAWEPDDNTPRYVGPALKNLFTTAQATGSLKLGEGRVRCADLIGVYDDPARPASWGTAIARNFVLDLRGQRITAEPANPADGLTLRADKPIRLTAPHVTGLLPSMLFWLDRLLAKVASFSLSSARILPDGRHIEVTGTLRLFGLPWPVTQRVPFVDLDAVQALEQAERALVDVERLLADPLAYVQPAANLINRERTHAVARIARDDRMLLAEDVALQARSSRVAAKVRKHDGERFKVSYGHRAEIVMETGARPVRVGVSVSMPTRE